MRGLDAATVAALSATGVHTAQILSIKYPTGSVRFTDHARDIDFNGHTYMAIGGVAGLSAVTETGDLEISTLVMEISAVDPAIVSTALTYDHINREVTLSRVVLDANGQNIAVTTVFDGLTSGGGIVDAAPGGSPLVQLEASSHFGDLDQSRGRFTNDESQQVEFPGDHGFEFVTELVEPIIWGRKDRL